jgi:hypothetical protein
MDDEERKKPYEIVKINEEVLRKYGVEEYTFAAKFDESLEGELLADVGDDVHGMFEDVLQRVADDYAPDDKVRIAIDHAGMDKEMTIHLQPRRNITAENIMNR